MTAMSDEVGIEIDEGGSCTVVRVRGYLDVSTSPRLREKLNEVVPKASAVVLDLSEIEFLDSSALGVILNAWKHLQADGGTLAVVSPQERITKIFEITALTLSINVVPSMDAAKERLGLA